MLKFSAEEILKMFFKENIKIMKGSTSYSDILFEGTVIEFLAFVQDLQVKHVFMKVLYLEEESIDAHFITEKMVDDEDIPEEYLHVIKDQVSEFNKHLHSLKEHIGAAWKIHLFFSHFGTVYGYIDFNQDILISDPAEYLEELLEELLAEHGEEIKRINDERKVIKINRKKEILNDLENIIVESDEFKMATNSILRRKLTYKIFREKEEYYRSFHVGFGDVEELIDGLWRKLKFELKKK